MAVPHTEQVSFHESGHLVTGYRSALMTPYEIYLETEHGELDGHLGANENEIPNAPEAVVRTTYAGPLAEMKRLAIDEFGAGTLFDLTDVAADLLSPNGHEGQIRLRFFQDGEPHQLTVAAAPFGTDINQVRLIIEQGHLTEEQVGEQLRQVRDDLDGPHIWAQIQRAVELLLAAPDWQVTRKGFHIASIAGFLANLDAVPNPEPPPG